MEKLFKMNRFSRKFVIWYLSKRENGEWRSTSLRTLFKKYKNIDAGYASYGWAREGIDGPLTTYIIDYHQKSIEDSRLNDTITFRYEIIPFFMSKECGAIYKY